MNASIVEAWLLLLTWCACYFLRLRNGLSAAGKLLTPGGVSAVDDV